MSSFTPIVKYTTDFDGDHLVFELRRMKVKHHAAVMRAVDLSKAGERESMIAETGQSVLPDCVVSMTGLTIAGQPVVDIKAVLDEVYFLPLVDNLLAELIRVSRVQETEVKNFNGPSGDTLKG